LRNPRLYGSRDEQIAGLALRSRGITGRPAPDPERPRDCSAGPARGPRVDRADTPRAHARRVAKLEDRMREAQAAARAARGTDAHAERVQVARELRANWLRLTGQDPVSSTIELAAASDACRVRAAA
jgi:hypothetical protein